jgi:gas vesicle protein GvpL/GvpF
MTLHLYAVTAGSAGLPQVTGIAGGAVRSVAIGDVSAVVGDVGEGPVAPTEAAVLEHARVVEELMGTSDALLPARFGHGFADEGELAGAIAARERELAAALQQVRACVELGLRVVRRDVAAGPASGGSGTDYMRRRLGSVREDEATANEVHDALAASARASRRQVLATPKLLLTGAYLVPKQDLDSFREGVDDVEQRHPELSFVCTGPWPPYSFATVDTDGSDA